MQFGFVPGKGTVDAIFIVRRIQEEYQKKDKKLYMCFVDMEKAFDRVPRKVMEWAMRKKGLSEVIVREVFFFFWKGSTFSDAGSDGTQPASCVDIQNHQSTYSCTCPMYRACQNDVFCSLFCSTTLAIRCRTKAPFVHERLKTPNTGSQAVEPDP